METFHPQKHPQITPNWFDRHGLGFINLILYIFCRHSKAETDKLSYAKPVGIHAINDLWPRPWLYSRVLLLFALAFAVLYEIWLLQDQGSDSNLTPGLTIVGALATPLAMLIFFYECNKFRSVPLLRVFQYMLIGSVVAIAITFLLTFVLDMGMDFRLLIPQRVRNLLNLQYRTIRPLAILDYNRPLVIAIYALFEEFGKTLVIFIFLMRHRYQPYILQGMLIGAAVGSGFAVFESAGYALTGSDMLTTILTRGLMAPVCHTAWGAIIGGGIMMLTRRELSYWKLFNPLFVLVFLAVGALHFAWNYALDTFPTLLENVQLGLITLFILFLMMWAGINQVRRFKRQGYLPVAKH